MICWYWFVSNKVMTLDVFQKCVLWRIAFELMDFNQSLYIDCWFRLLAVLYCIYHGVVALVMRLKYVFT